VVNENDAVADDEIRFGDNDRLAALVAHLVAADLLVLLTDTPGLLSADPRLDSEGPSSRRSWRSTTSWSGSPECRERAGERGHGLQAGRRPRSRRGRGAGRDRGSGAPGCAGGRGHGFTPGWARSCAPGEAAAGTKALDRLRGGVVGDGRGRRRRPPGPGRVGPVPPPRRCGRCEGEFEADDASRSPMPPARCSPRAWSVTPRLSCGSGQASAPPTSPRAFPRGRPPRRPGSCWRSAWSSGRADHAHS